MSVVLCLTTFLQSCDSGVVAPRLDGEGGARSRSIHLERSNLHLFQGETALIRAQVVGGDDASDQAVAWTSSSPAVASVSDDGTVSALSAGDATITATVGKASATARVRVSGRIIAELRISPEEYTLGDVGMTIQLNATAVDPTGAPVQDAPVVWQSLDTGIATVDALGQVTSRDEGVALITGTSGSTTDTVQVRVAKASQLSIRLSPPETVLDAIGDTVRITAAVSDAKGNPAAASSVKWASLEPGVASVDGTGLVTAKTVGAARIVGQYTSRTDTVTVVVRQVVASVVVTPGSTSVTAGQTQQMSAAASDSRGNAIPGAVFSWVSSNPGAATVEQSGLVRAVAAGVSYVTATVGGKSATATVTVAPVPVASVSVSPASVSVVVEGSALMDVVAKDAAGNVLAGRPVSWSTSNPAVATVSASGMVTGVGVGSAMITAAVEGKTAAATVSVSVDSATTPSRVTVTPKADTLIALGAAVQLAATVYSQAGSPLGGAVVTWSSLNAGVATVDASGKVTANGAGTARIVAASGGLRDTATVMVRQAVTSMAVSPSSSVIQTGLTQQISATAKDANGNVVAGAAFTWTSSNTAAATVDGSGVVKAVAAGVTYVTASSGGKSAVATVTVAAPTGTVASVTVSPGTASLDVGSSIDLNAVAKDGSGNVLTGRTVTWATSNASVATVSSTGIVKGVSSGAVNITATVDGRAANAPVSVRTPVSGTGPVFQDGFDAGVRAPQQNGTGWTRSGNGSLVAGKGRGGGYAMEFFWPATPSGTEKNNPPLREERFVMPGLREVWVEYWVKLPLNWKHRDDGVNPSNNKLLALWSGAYETNGQTQVIFNTDFDGSPDQARIVAYSRDVESRNMNQNITRHAPLFMASMAEQWHRIRFHVKMSSRIGAKDGEVDVWRDDVKVVTLRGWDLINEGELNAFTQGYLFGAQNSGYDQPTTIYLDDFKIYRSNPGW